MTTNVGRAPVDDGDATDDDAEEDAAIAISVINNVTNVTIDSGAILTSTGVASITSNNLVTATSIADGMLGGNDAGGGTLAMTTVTGDTILSVNGATITSGGDINLLANTIRSAKTEATATRVAPKTMTIVQQPLAVSRNWIQPMQAPQREVLSSRRPLPSVTSRAIQKPKSTMRQCNQRGGNLSHKAKAKHTVITKAIVRQPAVKAILVSA